MKRIIALLVWMLVFTETEAGVCDTVRLYFNTGEAILDAIAKQEIDKQIKMKILLQGKLLHVTGYADNQGGEEDNMILSEKRAKAVADYLLAKGWKKADIKLVEGKGEINEDNANGNPQNRRVDIIQEGQYSAKSLPENIFFTPGTDTVRPDNVVKLDSVVQIMLHNPCLRIKIKGHTCCSQHDISRQITLNSNTKYAANSISRSGIVHKYLVKKGIDKKRINYTAIGVGEPIYPTPANDDEHAMNCRVAVSTE